MKTKFNKLVVFILCVIFSTTIASNSKTQVYVVPIHDTIDLGIPAFVNRAINAAEKNNAELIIFDIKTFGGRVDAATQIKDAILDSDVPTIQFLVLRFKLLHLLINVLFLQVLLFPFHVIKSI